jgi:peptidylprolyl isomerase
MLAAALVAAFALSAVGCGGDDDDSAAATPSSTAGTTASTAAGASTCSETRTKPTVEVPATAPTTLVKKDLITGTGTEAVTGNTLTVQYVGVAFSDKKQFDASWDSGQPFTFQLGGNVITGWNQGMVGMKVCGRRQLVIPPDLGYGPTGSGPIKGNETLVFVVDLLAVE